MYSLDGNYISMGRKKERHTTQSSKKSQTRKAHPGHKDRLEKKWLKPGILLIGVFLRRRKATYLGS